MMAQRLDRGSTRRDTFGRRLKILRMDAGLRQEDLRAEMERVAGVSVGATYISELERTDKMPALEVAAAIARVLHTSTDYLGMITDDPNPPNVAGPSYLTPEADEVARLVDSMDAATRLQVVALAQRLAEPVTGQTARAREQQRLLDSVEALLGLEARRVMERAWLSGDETMNVGD